MAGTFSARPQVAFAILVAALAVAPLCAVAQAPPGYTEFKLQLYDLNTPTSTQAPQGTDFGDIQFFRNVVLDFNTNQVRGHNEGQCVYTISLDQNGNYEQDCIFTFVLQEGSFTVSGQFLSSPSDIAVVGGTGLFSGATGVARQSFLGTDGDTLLFGYNVQLFALNTPIRLPALVRAIGVPPTNGVCNASSANPNQCFNANGNLSICCPGQCPQSPGANPTCV